MVLHVRLYKMPYQCYFSLAQSKLIAGGLECEAQPNEIAPKSVSLEFAIVIVLARPQEPRLSQ